MRINYTLFGTSGPSSGGVIALFNIANGLIERGHEVTISSLGIKGDHEWFHLKAKVNYVFGFTESFVINILRSGFKKILKKSPPTYPYLEIKKLSKKIPECDINIATYNLTAFSVLASEKGIPFYHMQHYEPLIMDEPRLKKMAEKTYHLPLNKIANSTWLKNQIKERYGYDVPVVYSGIDHDIFYPREMGKNTSKMRVLCYGKQTRWKGFPEALEAMKIVMRNRNDVEFVVYGSKQLTYKTHIPYKFIQLPSFDELARLYSSADVVICPSWYESFPFPPIEAMACGTPVVTTKYGTEDYAFHEKNCLVVPPRDPKVLADAVLKLLDDEDLREKFRKIGPKTAKQFTWDKAVTKFEKIFKDALK